MTKLTALFLASLTTAALSLEPVPFTINTKKWSHVLDDHFISITVNPTDLLQGRVYGLQMNSTMSILKGLAPAYVRIGSADTGKYTFKRTRYPSDVVKPDDEYTVTETHWVVFNEVAQQAGLDVVVCLNAAHRSEGTKKWDTRNSLELISFSDSQGYNLTWQLGYEVQPGDDLSGLQFGKDLNRLRTILNAFPRYQHAKLIGPDIRVIHKKEEIDFWNDLLLEAGPTLDAVTWHPRWPQPSKMKVSDNSELGYEFPIDYLEWDRAQLGKILQKSIFKNPVWIGETKRESTGTFAEGLIWARRLVLAAKLGIEVVMKQPNLMDVTHPKPEYWIALLHKRLLGKSVLETKNVGNSTDLAVISHCTNPYYWSDKPEKLQDGSVTVYAVNMGGLEQKIQIRGTWTGKSQLVFQYVLTSGSDPDSVFSQMTYLNGEPLMMTDDGMLPDIIPKIKKFERGLTMKLPPYSVGYFIVPEAKVKICQIHPQNLPTINIETLTPSAALKSPAKTLENIRDINQFIVEKLKNPESESEEVPELKIEEVSSESTEKDISMLSKENNLPRVARRIRQAPMEELNQQIKTIMRETQEFLSSPENARVAFHPKAKLSKASQTMEQRIQGLAEGISDAIKFTNQEQEFNKFLEDSGLKQDFGSLIKNDRRFAPGMKTFQPFLNTQNPEGQLDQFEVKERLRRSISESAEVSQEDGSIEDETELKFERKILLKDDDDDDDDDDDEGQQRKEKQDLIIPHQPDIKGLEEKYKQIVQIKLQDGKRKIDDIKKKIKQEETAKPTETVNDIQEEIIKKEIELLEKTEETVADILKTQKKRQETFEDIIFDELSDVKGERIRELQEMHRSQRKKENAIVKRQVQTPLSKPLLKTVEYIEKNFNLEPESMRKIKRSLEERMGEILRNYDTKKSMEVKKRLAPLKDERKVILKKSAKDSDRKSDRSESKPRREDGREEMRSRSERREREDEVRPRIDRRERIEERREREREEEREESRPVARDRPREKNLIRKTSQLHHKTSKKPGEETVQRNRKSDEVKKPYEDDNDSFELFNEKKMEIPARKPERRRPEEASEGKKTLKKIKTLPKAEIKSLEEKETKKEREKEKEEEEEVGEEEEEKEMRPDKNEETEREELPPITNDKERREHMLQQISLMVDKMNSKERTTTKQTKEDDDISEEFDSEKRPRGIKRRPRKAEMTEEGMTAEKKPETPEDEVKPTAATKLSKLRKLRLKQSRKQKEGKVKSTGNEEEKNEESQQRKRHLTGMERPLFELEKKKQLIKPKIRKLSPKFHALANELNKNRQEQPVQQQKIPISQVQTSETTRATAETITTPPSVLHTNEELLKDLEGIVEEKIFLGKGSGTSNDRSGTSGEKSSKKKEPEEILSVTEAPAISKPTERSPEVEEGRTEKTEIDLLEDIVEEKRPPTEKEPGPDVEKKVGETPTDEKRTEETPEGEKRTELTPEDEKRVEEIREDDKKAQGEILGDAKNLEDEPEDERVSEEKPKDENNNEEMVEEKPQNENNSDEIVEEEPKGEEKVEERPEEERNDEKSSEEKLEEAIILLGSSEGESQPIGNIEDVLSVSEIRNLEAEMEKTASSEEENVSNVSSIEGDGQGVEESMEFAKRGADSGQRKRRATFLPNHGEEDEEDYSSEERIQKFKQMVYRKSPAKSPKKPLKNDVRSTSGVGMGADEFLKMAGSTVRVMFDDVIPEAYGQTKNRIQNMGITEYIKEFGNIVQQMKNLDQIFLNIGEAAVKGYIRGNRAEKGPYIQVISRKKREANGEDVTEAPREEAAGRPPEQKEDGSSDYATTGTGEEITSVGRRGDREGDREVGTTRRELGKSIHEDDKTLSVEAPEKVQEKVETAETKKMVEGREKAPRENPKDKQTPESEQNVPKTSRQKLHNILRDNAVSRKMIAYVPEDLQEKIFSPWIKTTKDFIQQALTTLQRQRELSEILANDLMNRDITKKAIGKREASGEEPKLPVYHMVPPTGNKKRETQTEGKQSDESLIRHLRGLQPGVYVVPTEEMTNIRSEQITNEARQESGMPNVVTLNIYYDKKNADGKVDPTEPKITQDVVTYYTNAWNNPNQYDAQYLNLPNDMSPTVHTRTIYTTEPRLADLPTSRLVQYPSPTYHYSPMQKLYPGIIPNPQPAYGPVLPYYLAPETRYASQPPGTKRQWREFKARSAAIPVNSGWNIQYDLPAAVRASAKPAIGSYNKNYKLMTADKKRSVGDFKMDPTWSEAALPFWKFFSTTDKKDKKESDPEEKAGGSVESSDSSEDVFEENRKRAKAAAEEKKVKANSIETVTEEKVPEEEEEVAVEEEEEKTRERRSVGRSKRSLYDFTDHDILPEWFGTYRDLENGLDGFPPHNRRSHIIAAPWSEEDEELLSILTDDELSLTDLDGDDYYYNDNNIQHLRRYPRSTDLESNMIKSNMIYKTPMDGDHIKQKALAMSGIKKLTDEDSSLETVTKGEVKVTGTETTKQKDETGTQPTTTTTTTTTMTGTNWVPLTTTQASVIGGAQPSQNGPILLPRNPDDDTFYYFFKYAYDSLVKVMKSMTEFF